MNKLWIPVFVLALSLGASCVIWKMYRAEQAENVRMVQEIALLQKQHKATTDAEKTKDSAVHDAREKKENYSGQLHKAVEESDASGGDDLLDSLIRVLREASR